MKEPSPLERHAEFIAAYRRLNALKVPTVLPTEDNFITVLVEVVEYAEDLEKLLKMVMKQ